MKSCILFLAQLSLLFTSANSIETSGFSSKEVNTALYHNGAFSRAYQDPNYIRFYLYRNASDEDVRVEMRYNDVLNLYTCGYDMSLPLILLIHGALSDSLSVQVQVIKNEYLRSGTEANIVMVDFGPLTVSHKPPIFSSLSFMSVLVNYNVTNLVAERTTDFLHFLMNQGALSGPEGIHLIGFGVGGHMAGAVGKNMYERLGKKIRRITALDPGVQFVFKHKIEPSDAEFVDITLTSLGKLADFKEEGHARFFINGGGPLQPTCPNYAPFTETYCSHTISAFYFAKSIRKSTIMGCACKIPCKKEPEECRIRVIYGEHARPTSHGSYYVKIGSPTSP